MATDDLALLLEYAESNSNQAFTTLVSRHVSLVYSVALRQVSDPHLAEDVTQATFIILARKAKSLGVSTVVSGWLCRTARYVATNALVMQRRRQFHERDAPMPTVSNEPEFDAWSEIAPLLDTALGQLAKRDHDAVVLRFFEGKDLKQVGAAMGTSEDAARMRINRALGKLKKFFAKRGVVLAMPIIAKAISANSVQAAPAGLAVSVTAGVANGSTVAASTLTLVKGALKLMAWTKMKLVIVTSVAILLGSGTAAVVTLAGGEEVILNIGDTAPAFQTGDWVKGKKIEKFEPGKTYVVEFWATWCIPCRTITPHLTEIAHRFKDKDVQFIGVDVWEDDPAAVKKFVDEMGDKMDYNVALDSAPKGGTADQDNMANHWLKAAAEIGVPTSFVVRDGKIAWIGHPMDLEDPLKKIVAGRWDLVAMSKKRLEDRRAGKVNYAVRQEVMVPFVKKDYAGTLTAINELEKTDEGVAKQFAGIKFASLGYSDNPEEALDLGTKYLKDNWNEGEALKEYFWQAVNPQLDKQKDRRIAELALKAMQRVVELSKKDDFSGYSALAEALFCTGDINGAVAAQQKAIGVLRTRVKDPADPIVKELNERLQEFRKAKQKKADGS